MHTIQSSILLFILLLLGCADEKSLVVNAVVTQNHYTVPETKVTTPVEFKGLSQVVAFKDWLFSGSKPNGESGFVSLWHLRVRTIICVDGTPPNSQLAQHFGIKTFHIPLKYGKPTEQQILKLATAVELGRLRGNTYIHCHHGKHRSAAAAAIALITLGRSTAEEIKERMHVSQTSMHYAGLWDAVEQAARLHIDAHILDEEHLTNKVVPEGITQQMVAMEFALDNLKRIKNSNWQTPTDHPDIVAASEAGAIAESLRYLSQGETTSMYPKDFSEKLSISQFAANAFEQVITMGNTTHQELTRTMHALTKSCTACHLSYRK